MTKRWLVFLLAFYSINVLAAAPVIYTAIQVGTRAYAVSEIPTIIGQVAKWFETQTAPTVGAQVATTTRIPTNDLPASMPPAPAAAATTSTTYQCLATGSSSSTWDGCNISTVTTVLSQTGGSCVYHTERTSTNCPFPPYQSTYDTNAGATVSCPNGYTLINNACSLENPRAATDDGITDIGLTGSGADRGFQYEPGDVNTPTSLYWDNSSGSPILRGEGPTPKQIYQYGTDELGRPKIVQIERSADGVQTYIREYTQVQEAGQTQVQTATATINNTTGIITQAQATVAAGSIAMPGNSTILATSNTAPTPADTPMAQTNESTPLRTAASIEFPNDYAKTGEAAAAAKTIADKLDNTSEVTDPTLPQEQEFADAFFKDTFAGLLAWQLPSHTSTCPVGSFDWNGTTYSVDTHCQLVQDHWTLLAQAMAVVWMIGALFIVMRA